MAYLMTKYFRSECVINVTPSLVVIKTPLNEYVTTNLNEEIIFKNGLHKVVNSQLVRIPDPKETTVFSPPATSVDTRISKLEKLYPGLLDKLTK